MEELIRQLNYHREQDILWKYRIVSALLVASTALLVLLLEKHPFSTDSICNLVLFYLSVLLATSHILCCVVILHILSQYNNKMTNIFLKALARELAVLKMGKCPTPNAGVQILLSEQDTRRNETLRNCVVIQYLLFVGELVSLSTFVLRLP